MTQTIQLEALEAFNDNYIWMLHDGQNALVVDPGDAQPVFAALQARKLVLKTILITHHHHDHTGGVDALRKATQAHVYGPAREKIPQPFTPLTQGQSISAMGLSWKILDLPGHTLGHIAYFTEDLGGRPLLFCGDTLFSGGCGRIFEGTAAQMLASLDKLAALPDNTQVCAAHEYTLSNLKFALAVEPDNASLQAYFQSCRQKRAQDLPTLPSSIGLEKAINPFLRSRLQSVATSVQAQDGSASDDVGIFAALREWKNRF